MLQSFREFEATQELLLDSTVLIQHHSASFNSEPKAYCQRSNERLRLTVKRLKQQAPSHAATNFRRFTLHGQAASDLEKDTLSIHPQQTQPYNAQREHSDHQSLDRTRIS
jgi:hypothetical protein